MERLFVAVVVTFNPDLLGLQVLLRSILNQVSLVVVVDNGSFKESELQNVLEGFTSVRSVFLHENRGLGYALNRGVAEAGSYYATHVLLMDQDSVPRPNMVASLATHLDTYSGGKPVAAIGPRFVDVVTGAISLHVRFEPTRIGRTACPQWASYVTTDFLITSGCLIPIHVLDDVGLMDESLFIDHVDTEWCLRAKSKGYELLGDCEALIEHDLGEYRKRIWFLRWREVPVHKPFRYYYIFRNSVLLYRRKYIPWAWIRIDLIRLVQIFGFSLIFGSDRISKIAMMYRGVRDAFLGKTGKLVSKD